MNWEKFKTKEKAHEVILESLILNPACAGVDGTIQISLGQNLYSLKPIKKKKNEKE